MDPNGKPDPTHKTLLYLLLFEGKQTKPEKGVY